MKRQTSNQKRRDIDRLLMRKLPCDYRELIKEYINVYPLDNDDIVAINLNIWLKSLPKGISNEILKTI